MVSGQWNGTSTAKLLERPALTPKAASAAGNTQHAAAAKTALTLANAPNAATLPSLPLLAYSEVGGEPLKVWFVNVVSNAVSC